MEMEETKMRKSKLNFRYKTIMIIISFSTATGLFEKAMSVKFCFAIFFIIFENMLVLHII